MKGIKRKAEKFLIAYYLVPSTSRFSFKSGTKRKVKDWQTFEIKY